jgi:septum formation protein
LRLVLASGSPRRKELLSMLGVDFEVISSTIAERDAAAGESAESYVASLAREKARDVASQVPDVAVVGGDTAVYLDGMSLGKPRDERHAVEMLRRLRGRSHEVTTGVVLICGDRENVTCSTARVTMRNASDEEIARYVERGESMDKAGAFAIQGEGGALVERVEGCYRTVVGLPLCFTFELLRGCGFSPVRPPGGWCSHCIPVD